MNRRSVLGFLGLGAAAGPIAAKSAAQMTLGDLGLDGVSQVVGYASEPGKAGSSAASAASTLARMAMMSDAARRQQKRAHYLQGLEPDIAALRSVNLRTKIRMSRDIQFERYVREQRGYLEGIIAGWWD